MIKKLFFVYIFVLLSTFLTTNANATDINYVPNYSFELGDNFPTNWSVSNEQFCNQQISNVTLEPYWNESLSYSGSKSFGFHNINRPKNSVNPQTRIISDLI